MSARTPEHDLVSQTERAIARSRERRVVAAKSRRRRLRSHGSGFSVLAVALATLTLGAGLASAGTVLKRGSRGDSVASVQKRVGVAHDGVFGKRTKKAVKRFQKRKGLTADGIVGPRTFKALGLRPPAGGARKKRKRVKVPKVLQRIAQCESGGNPRAVSRNGLYRGKYQFHRSTWRGLGGKGDPAKASEAKQDRLAVKLYKRVGTAPWASCA